jgi:hypothetical protein
MGAAILGPNIEYLFGDVTSGPNIDIRLKLYFKRDIYESVTLIIYYLDATIKDHSVFVLLSTSG